MMNNTIDGRTPEEIKRGLEYYAETDLAKKLNACKQGLKYWYAEDVAADALAYIQQLEAERDQYRCERDAAERDLKSVVASNYFDGDYCKLCKYNEPDGKCYHRCIPYSHEWGWQWRGVQEET